MRYQRPMSFVCHNIPSRFVWKQPRRTLAFCQFSSIQARKKAKFPIGFGLLQHTNSQRFVGRQPLHTPTDPMSNNKEFLVSNLYDVKGRVALITGGGSGIGLMTKHAAQALAVNGAKVYITGRTKDKLDTVVEKYGKGIEGEIIPLVMDVTDKASITQVRDEIASKEPCLCFLINNAGISTAHQSPESKTAEEMSKNLFDDEAATFEDWGNEYRTNVSAVYFVTTAFLPLLQKATEIHHGFSAGVINITSISGIIKSAQHHFQYNASKGAAVHLNRLLAAEIAATGLKIRVNAIAPGVFPSEMTAGDSDENQKSFIEKDKYKDKTVAQRPGKETDMANAILFVATNQYLNGQNIAVDGGYILKAGST